MNCEWLLRPKVATSEFAETFEDNLKYLASSKLPFLNTEKFTEWQQKLDNFIETLQKLNTTNDKDHATDKDVKTFLQTMLKDDGDMDWFFEDLVEAGSSMYLLGIHYTVVKTILSNPDWYAENSVPDSKALRDFKANASIKGLKRYLTETCTPGSSNTSTRSPSRKRNLNALLESDSESSEDQGKKKTKEKWKKKRKHASDEDVTVNESTSQKKNKKSKKSKKSQK